MQYKSFSSSSAQYYYSTRSCMCVRIFSLVFEDGNNFTGTIPSEILEAYDRVYACDLGGLCYDESLDVCSDDWFL